VYLSSIKSLALKIKSLLTSLNDTSNNCEYVQLVDVMWNNNVQIFNYDIYSNK